MKIGGDIITAAEMLQKGGLVAIPTETVYGLAANALDPDAILKIFKAKNRPFFDPLIVHCRSLDQVQQYVQDFPEPMKKLAKAFWPGPLTLLLPRNEHIPDMVCSGLPLAGFRIPKHELSLKLLEMLDFPLAAPSANPFGYVSPTSAQHVLDQLGEKIDYVLDGGQSPVGLESTIVSMNAKGMPVVHRYGGITTEALESVAGEIELKVASSSRPSAPGQLDMHYAPLSTLIFCNTQVEALTIAETYDKCGIICMRMNEKFAVPESVNFIEELSPDLDMEVAAKHLFAAIRKLDQENLEAIIAIRVEDKGLGKAINDRLRRATHLK